MTAIQPTTRQSTIEVRNPADGTVVGEVPNDSAETVAAKARELRLFQPEWEAIGAKGRKPWLLKFQDWILDNAEHITDVLQSETGKPQGRGLDGTADDSRPAQLLGPQRRGLPGRPATQSPTVCSARPSG